MAEITLTAADWTAMTYMNESQVAAYVFALGEGRYDGSDELVRVCFDISMANRMDVHEADERRLRDEEIRAESVIEKRREAGRKGGLAKARKMKQIVANVANVAKINLPENPSENVAKSFATNSDKSDSCEDGVVANVAKTFCYNSTRNNDESYCLLENSQSPSRACACGNDYNIASNNSISVIDNNIKHKPNNNSLIEDKKEKEKKSERKENEKAEDKKSRFVPPTIGEIQALIDERGYTNVSAGGFWNFYESKGWMIGKNKMRDWRAALAGWEARDRKKVAQSQEMPRTFTSDGSYYTETL